MRKKDVAGILALVLGGFGVHQFYLGNIGKGIIHAIFSVTPVSWIIAWITAIMIFSKGQEEFDQEYNKEYLDKQFDYGPPKRKANNRKKRHWEGRRYPQRNSEEDDFEQVLEKRWKYPEKKKRSYRKSKKEFQKQPNPFKLSGIKKFKDYDYEGAIKDFQEALKLDTTDIPTHFNLACAYSLMEQSEKAFFHLDKAVAWGFRDFDKIKTHDALAYLRIQDAFTEFAENEFRLPKKESLVEKMSPKEDLLSTQPDLLDQLKKLGDLKDKGLLTEEEFVLQKKKLLG